MEVALAADVDAVVYVELEETAGQLRPRRVYHVDLQADVGLASRQIDLVPSEVVQCQSAGARYLVLARAQINVDLRRKRAKKRGLKQRKKKQRRTLRAAPLVKVSLIFAGVIVKAAQRAATANGFYT